MATIFFIFQRNYIVDLGSFFLSEIDTDLSGSTSSDSENCLEKGLRVLLDNLGIYMIYITWCHWGFWVSSSYKIWGIMLRNYCGLYWARFLICKNWGLWTICARTSLNTELKYTSCDCWVGSTSCRLGGGLSCRRRKRRGLRNSLFHIWICLHSTNTLSLFQGCWRLLSWLLGPQLSRNPCFPSLEWLFRIPIRQEVPRQYLPHSEMREVELF